MDNRVSRAGSTRIVVVGDGSDVGALAAHFVVTRVIRNPRLAIALPTGVTPLPMYRTLAKSYRRGAVDWSSAHIFNLDEILGLAPAHSASYAAYLRREFLSKVNAHPRRVRLLGGRTKDPFDECIRHERSIGSVGGLGLAILGIGRNGHIAFNEPGSSLDSRTRVVQLAPETIEDNDLAQVLSGATAGSEGEGVGHGNSRPIRGLTIGIGTILQAREVILLATGFKKAGIVARALQGSVATSVPASALQLHANVTAILDREAASEMDLPVHDLETRPTSVRSHRSGILPGRT